MMRVGDRDGERVGGVGAGDLHSGEQARDHRVDLRFLGIADADHGFLDQPRGIFADVDAGAGGDHEHDAARLAELERRLRVLVDEHFLDGRGIGPVLGEQRLELVGQVREPARKRRRAVGLELAVGDVRRRLPSASIRPQPVVPRPGSRPRIFTRCGG